MLLHGHHLHYLFVILFGTSLIPPFQFSFDELIQECLFSFTYFLFVITLCVFTFDPFHLSTRLPTWQAQPDPRQGRSAYTRDEGYMLVFGSGRHQSVPIGYCC